MGKLTISMAMFNSFLHVYPLGYLSDPQLSTQSFHSVSNCDASSQSPMMQVCTGHVPFRADLLGDPSWVVLREIYGKTMALTLK